MKKNSIGIDPSLLKKIDFDLAIKRIRNDVRSDFIFAPHFSLIYHFAHEELVDFLKKSLKSGTHNVSIPITIDVPKTFTCSLQETSRDGPNFTRPGSILYPLDRLLYQVLADQIAPTIDKNSDKSRSYSHHLVMDDKDGVMFVPNRKCWNDMHTQVEQLIATEKYPVVLKMDIANFFMSINQHRLVNDLEHYGVGPEIVSCLEKLLTQFTGGERSSRGILQGIYPSDLIGNFYLRALDQFLEDVDAPSVRYVDDVYIFLKKYEDLYELFPKVIECLRSYDLALNEVKTGAYRAESVLQQDFELRGLFEDARNEFQTLLTKNIITSMEVETEYGFQTIWEEIEIEPDGDVVELEATKALFDRRIDFPKDREKIERFCLPLLAKVKSDHALDHVIANFSKFPAMSQIYCSYLSSFIHRENVILALNKLLTDVKSIRYDWQMVWVFAALLKAKNGADEVCKIALSIILSSSRHDSVKAVASLYVAKFGNPTRRRQYFSLHMKVTSPYMQMSLLMGSIYLSSVERVKLQKTLGDLSEMHKLVSLGVDRAKSKT